VTSRLRLGKPLTFFLHLCTMLELSSSRPLKKRGPVHPVSSPRPQKKRSPVLPVSSLHPLKKRGPVHPISSPHPLKKRSPVHPVSSPRPPKKTRPCPPCFLSSPPEEMRPCPPCFLSSPPEETRPCPPCPAISNFTSIYTFRHNCPSTQKASRVETSLLAHTECVLCECERVCLFGVCTLYRSSYHLYPRKGLHNVFE
jgi:hypothetical protein